MNFTDPRMARAMLGLRQRETQGEMEYRLRLRPVRARGQGALSGQSRRLLCLLGQRLVALGERLEQYGLPQPALQHE